MQHPQYQTPTDRIEIIFEDDEICVIHKPFGITVNRSETTIHQVTVQEWAEEKFKDQFANFKDDTTSDFYARAGIVHRLDKETSGILLIAKTPTSFVELQRQFKERIVKKAYVALVHGDIVPKDGEINMPVGRLPWNRTHFGIVPGGKESQTFYSVLHTYLWEGERLSFVGLEPKTGRTHQIRVHMKYLNHPIFADFLYAGRKVSLHDRKFLSRVFLHAASISFLHPVSGDRIDFSAPLPEELQTFLSTLKKIM